MRIFAATISFPLVLLAFCGFFPISEAQAAPGDSGGVHQALGTVKCVDCHAWLPLAGAPLSFRDETGKVCAGCHKSFHGRTGSFSHPADVRPSMAVPRDMPLDSKGSMTCFTCHTFHVGYKDSDGKKRFFLRRTSGKAFCYSCHKTRLF